MLPEKQWEHTYNYALPGVNIIIFFGCTREFQELSMGQERERK